MHGLDWPISMKSLVILNIVSLLTLSVVFHPEPAFAGNDARAEREKAEDIEKRKKILATTQEFENSLTNINQLPEYGVYYVRIHIVEELGVDPYIVAWGKDDDFVALMSGEKDKASVFAPESKDEIIFVVSRNDRGKDGKYFLNIMKALWYRFSEKFEISTDKLEWKFRTEMPVYVLEENGKAGKSVYNISKYIQYKIDKYNKAKNLDTGKVDKELSIEANKLGDLLLKVTSLYNPVYAPFDNMTVQGMDDNSVNLVVTLQDKTEKVDVELLLYNLGSRVDLDMGQAVGKGDLVGLSSKGEKGGSYIAAKMKVNGQHINLYEEINEIKPGSHVVNRQYIEVAMQLIDNFDPAKIRENWLKKSSQINLNEELRRVAVTFNQEKSSEETQAEIVTHEAMRSLIEQGANVNSKNDMGQTALMLTSLNPMERAMSVEILIRKGSDVNAKDKNGNTALMYAAKYGNISDVQAHYIVQEANRKRHDSVAVVHVLLRYDADVDVRNRSGETALDIALQNEHFEIAKVLMDNSAVVGVETGENAKLKLLMGAAKIGNVNILEDLLGQDFDLTKAQDWIRVDEKDKDGQTALMLAVSNNRLDAAQYLLERGADANNPDNEGVMPLMVAASTQQYDIVTLLLNKGAFANAVDKNGRTPLMWSSRSPSNGDYRKVIEALLNAYADVNATDIDGKTVLDFAREREIGPDEAAIAMQMLVKAGAKEGGDGVAAMAQPVEEVNINRSNLHATEVVSDISIGSYYMNFNSDHGFVYLTVGLPIIGEHNPFQSGVPEKISVRNNAQADSVNSVIIPKYFTKNAGFKAVHGIRQQTGKLIWLGFAVLFGFIAVLSKNLIAAFIGEKHPALDNIFWYGFGVGFFVSILFIDDFNDSFGKNRMVYFDNANKTGYKIIIDKRSSVEIGAMKNVGAYLKLGWNDLEITPIASRGNTWSGKIYVKQSDGYLVFNIGRRNQYRVETAVWR